MADIVSASKRSEMMAGIKGKDTKPEMLVRKGLFARGLRYRTHNSKIPGNPDLVFRKYNTVVFVNGCYWHGHENCSLFRYPKSKTEFWEKKIGGNIERDKRNIEILQTQGWKIALVWECALKGKYKLEYQNILDELKAFIKSDNPSRTFLEIRSTYLSDAASTNQVCVVFRD